MVYKKVDVQKRTKFNLLNLFQILESFVFNQSNAFVFSYWKQSIANWEL